jgi:hypothetical protein
MACTVTGPHAADYMGFSVRSAEWRLTEWLRYDKAVGLPIWTAAGLAATELYDHR